LFLPKLKPSNLIEGDFCRSEVWSSRWSTSLFVMNAILDSPCFFWFFFFGFNLKDFTYKVNNNYKSKKNYINLMKKQSQMRTLTTIISPFPFYFIIKTLNNRYIEILNNQKKEK